MAIKANDQEPIAKSLVTLARIAGIDIPREKKVEIALTYVYGIGLVRAKEILARTGVNPNTRVKDLTEKESDSLREDVAKNLSVEGELRRQVSQNIKRLKDISSFRGIRHQKGLPVRGQRTKTNARTRRGKKK